MTLTKSNFSFIFFIVFTLLIMILFKIEINIIVAVIALFALFYAIISSNEQIDNLSKQLELLEKHVFGEVYDVAQIKDLEFAKLFHSDQKKKDELLENLVLKKKKEIEIGIHWKMGTRQGLRKIACGFGGKKDEKPIIIDTLSKFVTKRKSSFLRDEHQDCWGWWHVEYAHSRITPADEDIEIAYKVKVQKPGTFDFNVTIYTDEAKLPFKKKLKVTIE